MIRINLLPHREAKRKERRTYFMIVAGIDVIVAVVVIGLVWAYFDQEIGTQNQRNEFLKKENAKLDQEIEEIQKLKEETDRLLARKQVIERLQGDRSEPVILLDQLARRVPDGVYLRKIEPCAELQCSGGSNIKITGFAQSSARVSTLMRNLDASPYMEGAELIEIKATIVDKRRLNEFSLFFRMKRTATDDQKKKELGKPVTVPAVLPAAASAPAAGAAPAPAAPAAGTPAAAPAAKPAATPATAPAPAAKK